MDELDEVPLFSREDVFEVMEDTFDRFVIRIFFFLMQMYTRVTQWYNTNEWIQKARKIKSHIDDLFTPYEIEPVEDSWKSILWIEDDKLHQTYIEASDEEPMVQYKKIIRDCKEDLTKDPSPIIIMKTVDGYYCNVLSEMYKDARLYLSNEPKTLSKVRFISVNYVYGEDGEKSLPIDVNRNFYMTGNDLFNTTFVYRALKYQSLPFEFNMNYTLQIIDDSANYVELKSDQYIHIEKDGYIVKKTDSTTESD